MRRKVEKMGCCRLQLVCGEEDQAVLDYWILERDFDIHLKLRFDFQNCEFLFGFFVVAVLVVVVLDQLTRLC